MGQASYAHLDLDGTAFGGGDSNVDLVGRTTLVDVLVNSARVNGPTTFVAVDAASLALFGGATASRFHGCDVDAIVLDAAQQVRVTRSTVGRLLAQNGGGADVTNSVLTGVASGDVVECVSCGELRLVHDAIVSEAVIVALLNGGYLAIVNSVIDLRNGGPRALLDRRVGSFAVTGSAIDVDVLLENAGTVEIVGSDVDLFNGCSASGCVTQQRFPGALPNVSGDPLVDPNDVHRVLDASPAVGLAGTTLPATLPSTVAGDFEGQCRTGAIDAGADDR